MFGDEKVIERTGFCFCLILFVIISIVPFGCSAHVERISIDVLPARYTIYIVYDTNTGFFSGRESFLRKTRREWYCLYVPKQEGRVDFEKVNYQIGARSTILKPVSGFVEVIKLDAALSVTIELIGTDHKPLPINGKYSLRKNSEDHAIVSYIWEE